MTHFDRVVMRLRRVRSEKKWAYLETLERRVMLDATMLPVNDPQPMLFDPVSQYVAKIPVTATVTIQPNTFGITVRLEGSAGVPVGIVDVYNGNTLLDSSVLRYGPWDQYAEITLLPGVLPLGTHTLTLHYRGDINYASWTESITVDVTKRTPTVELTLATSAGKTISPLAFTVRVSNANTSTRATGTVLLYDGDTLIGSGTLANESVTITTAEPLSVGTHTIIAVYQGDAYYAATTSTAMELTLTEPTVTLTMTAAATAAKPPTFWIRVTDPQGYPSGTVHIYDGDTLLTTSTLQSSGTLTITTETLPVGTHTITVEYLGDATYAASRSEELTITVEKEQPEFGLWLSSAMPGQPASFCVWMVGGAGDTVEIYEGDTLLGSGTLYHDAYWSGQWRVSSSTTTITVGVLDGGEHAITVKHLESDHFAEAMSNALVVNVTKPTPTVTLRTRTSSVPSTTTIEVQVGSTSVSIAPTGTIGLYNGETLLANVPVTGAITAIQLPFGIGTHTLTARYSGDTVYTSADSTPTTITVAKATTTTALSVSQTTIRTGDSVTLIATGVANSGTVTFYNGSTILGTAPLDATGRATFITVITELGEHSLTATREENSDYLSSTSAAVKLQVGLAAMTTVNLMVLYTWDLLSGFGINALILDAVKSVNLALINSQLPIEIVLVHTQVVDYVSSGNYHKDLTRLATPNNGYMDEVAWLRSEWQADLVSLFVGQMDNASVIGLGHTLTTLTGNVDAAYSVIYAWNAGAPTYTLAHELGHNFGALHDAENNTLRNTIFLDGLGWRFYGNNGIQYRDIMSYHPGTIIPYYSNPLVYYQGVPTGTITANAAGTILTTAPIIASYRTRLPPTPTQYLPIGKIETVDGLTVTGWAFDQDAGKSSVKVRIAIDGIISDPLNANQTRNDLTAQLGSPKHGWTYTLPAMNAGEHTIELYVQNAPWTSWVKVDERTITTGDILPELTVSLGSISPSYTTYIPGDWITIPVTITNTGLATAIASKTDPITIDLRLSESIELYDYYWNVLTLVHQLNITSSIPVGKSVTINAKVQIPTTDYYGDKLTAGEWYLAAASDDCSTVSAAPLNIAWMFGTIPGRKGNLSLTFHDDDGTKVTLALKGPGTGILHTDIGPMESWTMDLINTTAASTLNITTAKSKNLGDNGRFDFSTITIHGNIATINAKTTNLSNLEIQGSARTISLGNATGDLLIGPSESRKSIVNITLDFASCLTLNSQTAIGTLRVTKWDDGEINAPTLNALVIKGDMLYATLTLNAHGDANANYTVLGNATIAGQLIGGFWYIRAGGNIGTIKVASVDGWTLAEAGDIKSLSLGYVSECYISDIGWGHWSGATSVTGRIGSITAKDWNGGSILAASIGTIKITNGNFYANVILDGPLSAITT
ncbi:MAG: Ig-like domain repeat protein, partial [Phycisphaerales bacterium]|nr:Ig-like domain repeat protein [Phycisphaerales bacterium]